MVTMTILPNKICDSSFQIYSDNMIISLSQLFQPTNVQFYATDSSFKSFNVLYASLRRVNEKSHTWNTWKQATSANIFLNNGF